MKSNSVHSLIRRQTSMKEEADSPKSERDERKLKIHVDKKGPKINSIKCYVKKYVLFLKLYFPPNFGWCFI